MKKNKSTVSRRRFIQNTDIVAAVVTASVFVTSFSAIAGEKRTDPGILIKNLEFRMAGMAGPHMLSWARPGYRDCGLA